MTKPNKLWHYSNNKEQQVLSTTNEQSTPKTNKNSVKTDKKEE